MPGLLLDPPAWIFDLDDTLYPEREFVYGGYRAASQKVFSDFGISIEEELRSRFDSGQRGDLFTPCLNEKIQVDDLELYVQTLVKTYRSHPPELTAFADVRPMLQKLRETGRKIGLLTDGIAQVQKSKFSALGLEHFFDSRVFSDELGGKAAWKPSPLGYRRCIGELGVGASDAVYVGDNPLKDFVGARALGMRTVRIRRPGGEHSLRPAPTPLHEADFAIESLSELLSGK